MGKTKMPGCGRLCPRCAGPKPAGEVGYGIALSRRGRIAICSTCGTTEALLDAKIIPMDAGQQGYEDRIAWILKNIKQKENRNRAARERYAKKKEAR